MAILEELFEKGKLVLREDQKPYVLEILQTLLSELETHPPEEGEDVEYYLIRRIAECDNSLSQQLDEILHHPDFQQLEASWRGLHHLVMSAETGERLKLRLLNVSKQELANDLEKAIEFDQSALFKKVYEEEYGTFGGHPYSCLIGDFYFDRSPADISLLTKISNVAAAAHAPFIASAHPGLFDLDSFENLHRPRDLAKIFESLECIKWNAFRRSEDARYVTLCLPHILSRMPYGPNGIPVEDMNYVENVEGTDNRKFCWGNPAYMMAERITNAFALYGWTAAIRGVEGGGIVEDLPTYTFKTTDGDIALKCPTEISITDRREKELSDLGFVSLCHCKGTDYAAFFGAQTTQRPKKYNLDDANSNAQLSARLPYILAASRFAHYIKVIMRDKIGSFMTQGNVEAFLNNWISDYILLNDDAGQEVKARFPLREGRIDVFEEPGKPGSYKAIVYLRPHFQMEELTASIRLVAKLPTAAGG